MKVRRFGVVAAVALVAVALTLGQVGAATATGLTASAVKKIAGKVLKKKAKTLSVAHATTADSATSATLLSGATAAQLKTTGYRYLLPVDGGAGSRAYGFPNLPNGTYLMSYAMTINTTASDPTLSCGVVAAPSAQLVAPSYAVTTTVFARMSSSGIVTKAGDLALDCSVSTGQFVMNSLNDNMVTFVPIDTLVAGAATSSRATAESRPNGTP